VKYRNVVKVNTLNKKYLPPEYVEVARKAAPLLLGDWPKRQTWRIVERCVGYWLLWSQVEGGRREILERGWMSRRTAYDREAEFRAVFGMELEEFSPEILREFLYGRDDSTEVDNETGFE